MVQAEHVKEDLIPMFHNLANDEQVRMSMKTGLFNFVCILHFKHYTVHIHVHVRVHVHVHARVCTVTFLTNLIKFFKP